MARDLLTRRHSFMDGQPSLLTQGQLGIDSTLEGFAHHASDPVSLASMMVGSFTYKLARLGALQGIASSALSRAPRFLVNSSANLFALTCEVSAFRAASNGLGSLAGHPTQPGVFDANGWRGTFVDFIALKSIGHLGGNSNVVLTHFAQSSAMVIGHETTAALGFTEHQQGTFIQKLADAEATNIAMGAGMAGAAILTRGRIQHIERAMEARIHALSIRPSAHSLGARSSGIVSMSGQPALAVIPGGMGTPGNIRVLDSIYEARPTRFRFRAETVGRGDVRLAEVARLYQEEGAASLKKSEGAQYKEPQNAVEDMLQFIGLLNRPLSDVAIPREAIREQLRREVAERLDGILDGRAIEEFTTRESYLRDYYESRLERGLDNVERGEFTRPRSAWATAGRRIGIITAGQGESAFESIRRNYNVYPEVRRFVEENAELIRRQTSTHPDAEADRVVDVMDWIRNPRNLPGNHILNLIDMSPGLIGLATLTEWEVVRRRGFEAEDVDFQGATGFSQGIVTAMSIVRGLTPAQALTDLCNMGYAYRRSDPGNVNRKPMASVWEMTKEDLEMWAKDIQRQLGTQHRISVNRNTEWTHTISGSTEALAALQAKIAKANQGDLRQARPIQFFPMVTEGRFHHVDGMGEGERLLTEFNARSGIRAADPSTWRGRVISTFDGKDIRQEADPLQRTVLDRSTRPFDFQAQTDAFLYGVDLIIDLGPGAAIGGMARKNMEGTGARVISFKEDVGWAPLFTTNPHETSSGRKHDAPEVVRLPDGTEFINNDYLRALQGEVGSFVQIGAMTPNTGPEKVVVDIADIHGMLTGISSGSAGNTLADLMKSVNKGTRSQVRVNTNLMTIWKEFSQQVTSTFETIKEGGNLGIEVTAGLPEKLAEFVQQCHAAGVNFPQLKIGPYGQAKDIVALAKEHPEFMGNVVAAVGLMVALEGGQAGGHHAPYDLIQMWRESYDQLREVGAIVIAAGGIVTPQDVAQMMTHGPADGRRHRPASAVVVGSGAMNFDVMNTTDVVREANARARAEDIGTLPSQASGPQHVLKQHRVTVQDESAPGGTREVIVPNEYFARCLRLEALVARKGRRDAETEKTVYDPWTPEERLAIIADLNASQTKPYFQMRNGAPVELHQMTFGEILNRWVELSTYEGTMRPPYPEYYNHSFVRMMRTMEVYVESVTGRKPALAHDAKFMGAGQAAAQSAAFLGSLGKVILREDGSRLRYTEGQRVPPGARVVNVADLPVGAEVAVDMKNIWHSAGEFHADPAASGKEKVRLVYNHFPQRFVVDIEPTNLVANYKSGQTQYTTENQGYRVEQLLIQTGTQAANKITEANVNLEQWHADAIRETVAAVKAIRPGQAVREVSEPGARPYQYRDLAQVKGVTLLSESEGTRRYRVGEVSETNRADFVQAMLNQGTGVLRTAMDTRYRYDAKDNRTANDLRNVFEPQAGQVVEVITEPSGNPARPDPVLRAIRIYEPGEGQPSAANLKVEYLHQAENRARLVIHEHTFDGRDVPFEWQYEVSRHHGYMTKVSERQVDAYETYQNLFQLPARTVLEAQVTLSSEQVRGREKVSLQELLNHVREVAASNEQAAAIRENRDAQDVREMLRFRRDKEIEVHDNDVVRLEVNQSVEGATNPSTQVRVFVNNRLVMNVYRSGYEVKHGDLTAFRNAVEDRSTPYTSPDANGKLMAPLSMLARMGAEAWTASAFARIMGGNPANLRHTFDKVEYFGERRRWVRSGDRVETEVYETEESLSESGVTRRVEGDSYLVGENTLFARSYSSFLTLGVTEQSGGFATRDRNLTLKIDNPFIRALNKGHEIVKGITLTEGVKLEKDQEIQLRLNEDESVDVLGNITSHLTGQVLRAGQVIGQVDHQSTREKGQAHPLIEREFVKRLAQDTFEYKSFPHSRLVLTRDGIVAPVNPGRYSKASGDINPIHTNRYLARKMGMADVIEQGMWTKATAMALLSESDMVRGRVDRIESVEAQMLSPVLPGEILSAKIEEVGAKRGRLVAKVTLTKAGPKPGDGPVPVLEMLAYVRQGKTVIANPGQGDQEAGMAGPILEHPVGKAALEALDRHNRSRFGYSLLEVTQRAENDNSANGPITTELKFMAVKDPETGRAIYRAPVRHPKNVLHRTDVTQPALYTMYEANRAILEDAGLVPEDVVFIGNSLGEYSAPVFFGKISPERGLELVDYRGNTMKRFIEPLRDADGKSPFRMDAIAIASREEIERFVDQARRETGKFVQTSVNNRPTQTTITGEIEAVKRAGELIDQYLQSNEKYLNHPVYGPRLRNKESSVTELTIDTPFHTMALAFGIPEFWALMERTEMAEGQSPEGRYVPCIHGKVFRVNEGYIDSMIEFIDRYEAGTRTEAFQSTMNMMRERMSRATRGENIDQRYNDLQQMMVTHRAQLNEFKAQLAQGRANRLVIENYLLKLGLVYQFASTVEWVKVQQSTFDPNGEIRAERIIENGVKSTIKDHLDSTGAKVFGDRVYLTDLGNGIEKLSLGAPADREKVLRTAKPKAVEKAASPVQQEAAAAEIVAPAAATAPVAAARPAGAASATPAPERPTLVGDVLRTIVGLVRNLRAEQVDESKTLSTIMGGSDKAIPVKNNYTDVEWPGLNLGGEPHKVPLAKLISTIGGQLSSGAAGIAPGAAVRKAFNENVATKLTGISDFEAAWQYLAVEWPTLPEGRRFGVVLHGMSAARAGKSAADQSNLGVEGLILADSANGKDWLDRVVRDYAQRENIQLSSLTEISATTGGAGGGMSVKMEEVIAAVDEHLASVILQQVIPGVDVARVRTLITENRELAERVARLEGAARNLDNVRSILGDNFVAALRPVFDPNKVRLVGTNFIDAELTDWLSSTKFALRDGTLESPDHLDHFQQGKMRRMANRATGRTVALLRYQLGEARKEIAAIDQDYPQMQTRIETARKRLVQLRREEAALEGAVSEAESLVEVGAIGDDSVLLNIHRPALAERRAEIERVERMKDADEAFLEVLRAQAGAEHRAFLGQYENLLVRMESMVASRLVNPNLSMVDLMRPGVEMHPPVYRPDDVHAYTTPSFEMKQDGRTVYKEVPRPPTYRTENLIRELEAGGTLREGGAPVMRDGRPVHIDFISGQDRELILEAMRKTAETGRTFQDPIEGGGYRPQIALMVGASPNSLNLEKMKAYAAGGARLIVSTSKADYNEVVDLSRLAESEKAILDIPASGQLSLIEYMTRVFTAYQGTGATLEFLNYNTGSQRDVIALGEWLKSNRIYPHYVENFAAWPLSKDSHLMTGTAKNMGDGLATWMVNFMGYQALWGTIAQNMADAEAEGYAIPERAIMGLPGSPNRGLLVAGEYPKIQAAKDAWIQLWHSDPTVREYTALVDDEFGWGRGTNLMGAQNDNVVAVEAQMGIRTHSQADIAAIDMAARHPSVLEVAATRPVHFSSQAGFSSKGEGRLATEQGAIVAETAGEAELRSTVAEAAAKDSPPAEIPEIERLSRQTLHESRRAPGIIIRATDTPLNIPLEQTIVIVGGDSLSAGGDRVTSDALQRAAGIVRDMTDESILRLARFMDVATYDGRLGRLVALRTSDNQKIRAGETINAAAVRDHYAAWMQQHVLVRKIDPDLHGGFDPERNEFLMKVSFVPGRVLENLSLAEVNELAGLGEAHHVGEGKYRLVVGEKGGSIYLPAENKLNRIQAGQVPNHDWLSDGFPADFVNLGSRAEKILIRTIAGALASIGLTPEIIERDPTLNLRLGLTIGAGLGPMDDAGRLHREGLFAAKAPAGKGPAIVHGLTNMPLAMAAMGLLRHFTGPKNVNVAACATSAESLAMGIYQLHMGEVDVVLVGGVEAPIGQAGNTRFAEIDATQTIEHLTRLGIPMARAADLVFDIKAAGFVPGEGAGVVVLTRGDIAFNRGWRVEAVVYGVVNASGGQKVAAAAPDPGIVTRLPLIYDAWGKPYGLNPNQVGLFTPHGTGTPLGDGNDANISQAGANYNNLRDPGKLYAMLNNKGWDGHSMGAAYILGLLNSLRMMETGYIPPRQGLHTVQPIIDGMVRYANLNHQGMQVDPGDIEAALQGTYGFGAENLLTAIGNGRRVWPRLVMGQGRGAWAAYQGRLERTQEGIDTLAGELRTGRRRLVTMNEAVTNEKATPPARFEEDRRRLQEWLENQTNRNNAMGNPRPR